MSACKLICLFGGIALGATIVGCDGLLDVENPNNVTDDDIRNAEAAATWANGSLFAVQRGWDGMLETYSFVTDELTFKGTRREWDELDRGNLLKLDNDATTSGFQQLAAGIWMADEAIFVLDSLDQLGELTDRTQLARAYFYASIGYTVLANWLDDYAFADRTEPGPAVGPDSMGTLYDTAIQYLTRADTIAPNGLRRDVLAMRAKARHEQGIWNLIGKTPISLTNGGLVGSSAAVQDALSSLAEDGSDWRYEFDFDPGGQSSGTACAASCFIGQGRLGDRYVHIGSDGVTPDSIALLDPIDSVPDPRLERFVFEELASSVQATSNSSFATLTVFSARELHLIIAEDALARGDTTTFATQINVVRGFEGLTGWSSSSGISARDMLIYERQVNLFLQGHRLNDLYRFGLTADNWDANSVATTVPGTFFPIPRSEIDANCHLNPGVDCP